MRQYRTSQDRRFRRDPSQVGRQRWTVDDCLRVTARFAQWLETGDANRLAREHVWSFAGPLRESDSVSTLAAASNTALANEIRSQSPIWCDPAMVDLLAVAAAEMPALEGVEEYDLPHPRAGLVIFAKPLPAEWHGALDEVGRNCDYSDQISAVSWEHPHTNAWVVRSWVRGSGVFRFSRDGLAPVHCPDLRPSSIVEIMGDSWVGPVGKVLCALTALARTSGVVGECNERPSKAAALTAQKAKMPAGVTVRRLYLTRPDSGAEELASLRAKVHGSSRGHWVRGYWRHTWFASVQEHRWRWVEGFPRGDFTQGSVTGGRVQVARGDTARLDQGNDGPDSTR